jgi:hypothetical protein
MFVADKNNFTHECFILDGSGVSPNPNQVEWKCTGNTNFVWRNFECRRVSEGPGDGGGDPHEHIEGVYCGANRQGLWEYGYWHHIDSSTVIGAFITYWNFTAGAPGSIGHRTCQDITFRKCRFGVSGYNGNGQNYDGSGLNNIVTSQHLGLGAHTNIRFEDCQLRQGVSKGDGGIWTYNGSTSGGSGAGFLSVPTAQADAGNWPAFPDGTQGPPVSFNQGVVIDPADIAARAVRTPKTLAAMASIATIIDPGESGPYASSLVITGNRASR